MIPPRYEARGTRANKVAMLAGKPRIQVYQAAFFTRLGKVIGWLNWSLHEREV